MRYRILKSTLLLGALLVQNLLVAAPQTATVGDIKNSLVCQCNCGMTVEACEGSMACESSKKLTEEAAGYLAQGLDRQAVLAAFTAKYGEQILAAPTKSGFNLTAWVLPFAALLFASLAITFALKRWVRVQPAGANQGGQRKKGSEKNTPYEDQLDKVLRHLD